MSQRLGATSWALQPKSIPVNRGSYLPRPALVAVCFIVGVIVADRAGVLRTVPAPWIAAMVLILTLRRLWGDATGYMMLAFLAGGTLSAREHAQPPRSPIVGRVDTSESVLLDGIVAAPIERRGASLRFNLRPKPAGDVVAVTVRGSSPELLPGDRIEVRGRLRSGRGYWVPGASRQRARALASRGARFSLHANADDLRVVGTSFSLARWPVVVQRALVARVLDRGGAEDGRALVRGMAFGDRGGVSRSLEQRFRDAGLAHLLAVSGLHLGAVALLLFVLVRRLWASVPNLAVRVDATRVAALVAACGAVFYTLLTGARISTVRALVVALVVLGGAALCRRARFVDALGVAALVLVGMRPSTVFEPAFQLSFAATLTLALTMGADRRAHGPLVLQESMTRVRRVSRRFARWMLQLVTATAWVTLATAPLTAMTFGSVSSGGLLSNIVAVPLVELIVLPFALIGTLLSLLSTTLGGPLIDVAVFAAEVVATVAENVARVCPASSVLRPNTFEMLAALSIWAAAIAWRRRLLAARHALVAIGIALLCAVGSWAYTTHVAPRLRDDLRVTFIDVGQGDAALIELPGGGAWLIDSGGLPYVPGDLPEAEGRRLGAMPGERAVAVLLEERRIRVLDVVAISHAHPDHYRGLRAVARVVKIRELWIAKGTLDGAHREFAELVDELKSRGTRVVHPTIGRNKRSARGDVSMLALAPQYERSAGSAATSDPIMTVNDNSLVLRVEFAGRSLLFTGDIEGEGEEELMSQSAELLSADVVKVPHHGSDTSSGLGLVETTRPGFAVISCGVANRFGFPSQDVVRRWTAQGARVLRTDLHGSITVVIDSAGGLTVRSMADD